jgi:hypothetical protein
MERQMKRTNAAIGTQVRELRHSLFDEFGLKARVMSALVGPMLWWSARREQKRLAKGWTYEPETFLERRNWAGEAG